MRSRACDIPALLFIATVLFLCAMADSHHTNLYYIGWKHGLLPYAPNVSLRYFNVDISFRESLHGKTKVELGRWFPSLRPPELANSYQRYYSSETSGCDCLWIGDSNWAIFFQDGRASDILLLKG